MLWSRANNTDHSFSANYFAFIANGFYGSTYFHGLNSLKKINFFSDTDEIHLYNGT